MNKKLLPNWFATGMACGVGLAIALLLITFILKGFGFHCSWFEFPVGGFKVGFILGCILGLTSSE